MNLTLAEITLLNTVDLDDLVAFCANDTDVSTLDISGKPSVKSGNYSITGISSILRSVL